MKKKVVKSHDTILKAVGTILTWKYIVVFQSWQPRGRYYYLSIFYLSCSWHIYTNFQEIFVYNFFSGHHMRTRFPNPECLIFTNFRPNPNGLIMVKNFVKIQNSLKHVVKMQKLNSFWIVNLLCNQKVLGKFMKLLNFPVVSISNKTDGQLPATQPVKSKPQKIHDFTSFQKTQFL